MAGISDSVEIQRKPEEVFAYIDDLAKHGEWQDRIEAVRVDTEGPTRVGTRVTETRRMPGGSQDISYEIVAHDSPRSSSFRGLNGLLRPVGTVRVEPVEGGTSSRVTVDFDFEPQGIGHLLAPLARGQVRKEMPKAHARLKEILERSS